MQAGFRLRNVLEGRHPPLNEKFGQKVTASIEQKIRKQCESLSRMCKFLFKVAHHTDLSVPK